MAFWAEAPVIQPHRACTKHLASSAEDGWWRHQPWRFEAKRPSFSRTEHVQNTWLTQLKMVGGDTNHGVLRRSACHSTAQSVYKTLV